MGEALILTILLGPSEIHVDLTRHHTKVSKTMSLVVFDTQSTLFDVQSFNVPIMIAQEIIVSP